MLQRGLLRGGVEFLSASGVGGRPAASSGGRRRRRVFVRCPGTASASGPGAPRGPDGGSATRPGIVAVPFACGASSPRALPHIDALAEWRSMITTSATPVPASHVGPTREVVRSAAPPLLGSSTTGKIKPASVLTSGTSPPGRPDDHRMLLVVAQTRSTHSHDLTKPHARRLQHTVTHSLPPRLRKPLPGPSAPDRQSPIPAPPILRLRQVGLVAHRPGNLIHQSSPRSLRHPHRATHPTAQSPPFLWLLPMPS